MNDSIFIHLPHGFDIKLPRRHANRLNGKELLDLCWKVYPDVKQSDRVFWSIRSGVAFHADGGFNNNSQSSSYSRIPFASHNHQHDSKDDETPNWIAFDKKFADYNFKTSSFYFCPRIYPEGWHQLSNVLMVELLFLSIKRSIYDDELKFTDTAKDCLAGYALQAYIGNYRSEHESRSALRRLFLVKIGRDLDYWAESERRAVSQHRKMAHMGRGRAITSFLRVAQEQPTYGVQYHRGISDKGQCAL
jgi:hypothetical protein